MQVTTKIRSVGRAKGVIIPARALVEIGAAVGDEMEISIDEKSIVLKRSQKAPRLSLLELVQECDLDAEMPADASEWDSMPHFGAEH